jgi:prolyl-tRNA synthetase
MLRMSTLFLRTLREDPADAEVPSHKLLVRAGYIRRWAPGVYSLLPLGQLVHDNVARIVHEEMRAIGAQQVTFPALLPREYYETTGRWTEYGDTLFRLKDRKGADYLLGPTHEELFTLLVKDLCSSYKDLPLILYQIQTKYRDEARPRSGILRGREFTMKDSYSFDVSDDGLAVAYQSHRDAYIKTFDRLGLNYRIVSAMSGAMGGSKSEEFLAPSPIGEDTFVMCSKCEYAANVEAVQVAPPAPVDTTIQHPAMRKLVTPDAPGITALVTHLNSEHGTDVTAKDLLKNIVFKLDGVPIIALVPGDRRTCAGEVGAVRRRGFRPFSLPREGVYLRDRDAGQRGEGVCRSACCRRHCMGNRRKRVRASCC